MFHMTGSDVEVSVEAAALRLLGHGGEVVGPLVFGAVRFWAAVVVNDAEVARRQTENVGALEGPDELSRHLAAGRPPAVRLRGCLVSEPDSPRALQHASLLAGYAPRSILIDESVDVLAVSVDAALLDQGVIVRRGDGRLEVVATPGSRVPGHGLDNRELALREKVYGAWLAAASPDTAGHPSRNRLGRRLRAAVDRTARASPL
jgi:hypothetical protein